MANIHSRLSRLEEAITQEEDEGPLSSVPAEWCEYGDDGVIVVLPPGVQSTPGQCDTLSILMAMDATIGLIAD